MTVEGAIVAELAEQPGCQRRAGLTGAVSGLDAGEVLARLPDGLDTAAVRALLPAAEAGVVKGSAKEAARQAASAKAGAKG